MQNKYSRNLIIGVSFLVALVLVYFGVNFLKGVNVLKKQNRYVVIFNDVTGLYTSSPIYVNGYQVGLVSDMKMVNSSPIEFAVGINLEGNYRIPVGSTIEFGSDLLGATAASIIANTSSNEFYVPGDTLYGKREDDMIKSVGKLLPRADSLLQNINMAVVTINDLMVSDLWIESLEGIGSTISSLDEGGQKLNTLLTSLNKNMPEITDNVGDISKNLNDVTSNLSSLDLEKLYSSIDKTLENIESLSNKINSDNNSIGMAMSNTQLHDSLTHTLSSVSQLLDEIRQDPQKYLSVKVKLF